MSNFEASGGRSLLPRLKRLAIVVGVVGFGCLILFLMLWNTFFVYVPPGKHLVIISKNGDPLPANHVLAEPGQQGVGRKVHGEGWHFVTPVVYQTSVEPNTIIEPGQVGLVTALGGDMLPVGQVLADEGQQGIQRQVLLPGAYRINRHGYRVEAAKAVEVRAGHVGVMRRLLGTDGRGRYAMGPDEKGILPRVLQPGLYYLNPREYEVVSMEVGIFQTSFHYDVDPRKSTALTFTSKGGFPISLDCTIEWEVLPTDMPFLLAEYGTWRQVEQNLIQVQAHAIGRDKGVDYGVQDLLEGRKREKFQTDFTDALVQACTDKKVTIHSAFIRNVIIPENYLKPIRDKQLAAETELTNQAKQLTALSEAEVERQLRLIDQRVAEVQAETNRIVAGIDRDVQNTVTRTQAEIDKLKAEYEAKIATLDAERLRVQGEAETQVTKLKETAKGGLYQLKMEVFQNDASAFLRYTLAEQLNPKLTFRVFHSGPGTFWTNLSDKNVNLMLPTQNGTKPAKAVEKPK